MDLKLLKKDIREVLYFHDPVGIADPEANPYAWQEYDEPAAAIALGINEVENLAALESLVYEEAKAYFGRSTPNSEAFEEVAKELWNKFRKP